MKRFPWVQLDRFYQLDEVFPRKKHQSLLAALEKFNGHYFAPKTFSMSLLISAILAGASEKIAELVYPPSLSGSLAKNNSVSSPPAVKQKPEK